MNVSKVVYFLSGFLYVLGGCANPGLSEVQKEQGAGDIVRSININSFLSPAELYAVQNDDWSDPSNPIAGKPISVDVAIQSAIDALSSANVPSQRGGILVLPKGVYRTSHTLFARPFNAIIVEGEGGASQGGKGGTTVIYARHAEQAVFSLQGSVNCQINNISLQGDVNLHPQVGLLLAREGAGSAGWHSFNNLAVSGHFQKAGIYNVASEGNTFANLSMTLDGDEALYGMFFSQADTLQVGPPYLQLTGSTLLGQELINSTINVNNTSSSASCIYINGGVMTGSISFRGGYLTQPNGSFVSIDNGAVDGQDTLGPIVFQGLGGERPGGAGGTGMPVAGFNIFCSNPGAPVYLLGLEIRGCSFLMDSGKYILQDETVRLRNAVILSQGIKMRTTISSTGVTLKYPEAVESTIGPLVYGFSEYGNLPKGYNLNCQVDVGFGTNGKTYNAELLGTWSNTFSLANGFGSTSYYQDNAGTVHLLGAPGSGVSGSVLFTLPVGFRPARFHQFSVRSNISSFVDRMQDVLTVQPNGDVIVTGDGVDPVFLSSVSFPANK